LHIAYRTAVVVYRQHPHLEILLINTLDHSSNNFPTTLASACLQIVSGTQSTNVPEGLIKTGGGVRHT